MRLNAQSCCKMLEIKYDEESDDLKTTIVLTLINNGAQ